MNSKLVQKAKTSLIKLRKSLNADLLTCYFHNPHSGYYWLFYKDGEFNYPYQMNGPLTAIYQDERMNWDKNKESKQGVKRFKNIPPALSRNILSAVSFIKREKIKHCIRIRICHENDKISKDPSSVIIFLNYRKSINFPSKATAESKINLLYQSLKGPLIPLSTQPKLNDADAWRLRSVMLKFQRKLGGVLGIEAQKSCEEIYQFIVEQTLILTKPRNGKNILCDFSTVNADNEVTVLYVNKPNKVTEPNKGIVAYVGQTGQIFLINDVKEYQRKTLNSSDYSLPKYIECNNNTLCEIAIPLIIENCVIGVLNLEADVKYAYDDAQILILFQFAAAAAQALHRATMWKNINTAINQNHSLRHINEEKDIFNNTIDSAKTLGYSATIWDFQKRKWYQQLNGTEEPRVDGFSHKVRKDGLPIALADLRIEKEAVIYNGKIGVIDSSGLFIKWDESEKLSSQVSPSKSLIEMVRNADKNLNLTKVITDLGFPIFELKDDGSPGLVRAILWVKCKRHFLSLLNDDCWCLSILCRNTSDALKVFNKTTHDILTYHFGERTKEIMELNHLDLVSKEANNIIILNIDIRGSTKLGKYFLNLSREDIYVEIISRFHSSMRTVILKHGGVMDKTMGDGVHALFNVYRPDILSIGNYNNIEQEIQNAINCAFESFIIFEKIIESYNKQFPLENICLGAGLAMGNGFIGSFSNIKGLEYSVLSDAANRAGKMVSDAKSEFLKNYLIEWRDSAPKERKLEVRILSGNATRNLEIFEIDIVVKALEESVSVLCLGLEFFKLASDPKYICFYIIHKEQDKSDLYLFLASKLAIES